MTERLGKAVLELATDSGNFHAELDKVEKRTVGLTAAFSSSKSGLDKMMAGMVAAGKEASASGQMIAGMGEAGKKAAADLEQLNKPLDKMAAGMTAAGKVSVESSRMIAGMSASGRDAMQQLGTATTTWFDKLTNVQNAVKGLLALQVVKWFTDALAASLDYAASLDKMKTSTDISFEGLQQLENIAVGSNTTLQALTSSVLDLQRKLAMGDDSAVGAIRTLGFETDAFLKLKGDEQFLAVSRALGKMSNETERNTTAFQLFGRSYKEIISALASDVDGLKNSVTVMADAQVKRLADLETRWEQVKLAMRRASLEAVENATTFTGLLATFFHYSAEEKKVLDASIARWGDYWDAVRGNAGPLPEPAKSAIGPPALPVLHGPNPLLLPETQDRLLNEGLRQSQEAFREREAAAKKAADAAADAAEKATAKQLQFLESVRAATDKFTGGTLALHKWVAAIPGANAGTGRLAETMLDLDSAVGMTAADIEHLQRSGRFVAAALVKTNNLIVGTMADMKSPFELMFSQDAARTATAGFASTLHDTMARTPQMLMAAFTGGGGAKGAAKAIATDFGSSLFGPSGALAGATKSMTGGLTKMFGKTIGGALGAALPGIGALIGPGIELLWKGIKKLFGGPGEAELAARDQQQKILDQFRKEGLKGTDFDVLLAGASQAIKDIGGSAEDARLLTEKLLDTGHPERYKAAVEELNRVLAQGQAQWEATAEAASDLNAFSKEGIDSLGEYQIAAGSAVAIFDAWLKKTGDVVGALEQIGPTLDALDFQGQMDKANAAREALMKKGVRQGPEIDALDTQWDQAKANLAAFGAAGGAAIEQLLGLRRVTEANKPLMEGIGQSTRLLTSMGKAGLLTEDLLMSFGQHAVNQFTVLKKATGDSKQALVLMQPELQQLWQHQQKFGKFADVATQALIDQAEAEGVVGPEMKDINEQIRDVMIQIRDVIAEATGQTDKFKAAIDKIPTEKTLDIDVTYDDPGFAGSGSGSGDGSGGAGGENDGFALGTPNLDYVNFGRKSMVPLHGMEAVVPQGSGSQLAGEIAAAMGATGGDTDGAILDALQAIELAVRAARQTSVQIDGRELVRAEHRVYDNGGAPLSELKELVGVR